MLKIKRVLVSQPIPAAVEKSPFYELTQKYGIEIDYRPFIRVEGVSAKEFRSQRIEILDHTAIVFTSRTTVDNFFRICEESRITIPETMKYLCYTEAVALYLQKYIVYRKRKISFADGTFTGLMELILKHRDESILLTLSEPHKAEIPDTLEKLKIGFHAAVLARTVGADLSDISPADYQLIVLYSPMEVKTLIEQFPGAAYPMLAAFGDGTTRKAIENDLTVNVMAPTPEVPSMAKALDIFIGEINSGKMPARVEAPRREDNSRVVEEFVKTHQAKELRRARAKKKPLPAKPAPAKPAPAKPSSAKPSGSSAAKS